MTRDLFDTYVADQNENEWVCVLQGTARLRFEDQTIEMKPGDFVNIPAHTKHRVEWTPDEPTIWLAVHYGGGEMTAAFAGVPHATSDHLEAAGNPMATQTTQISIPQY